MTSTPAPWSRTLLAWSGIISPELKSVLSSYLVGFFQEGNELHHRSSGPCHEVEENNFLVLENMIGEHIFP